MAKYLILARDRGAESFGSMSPAEMQAIIERYVAWSERLRAAGHLESSNKLRDGEGKVVSGDGDDLVVTDGPYSETKEVVGGYWLIEAKSYDQVVDLLSDSPHLEFGNLEVRAIEEL